MNGNPRQSRGKYLLFVESGVFLIAVLLLGLNRSQKLGGILYFPIFIISFVLSLVLTDVVKRAMLRLGVLDQPNEARWHRQPVALLGGIAIFQMFSST